MLGRYYLNDSQLRICEPERHAVATRDDYLIETLTDMGLLTAEQLEPVRQEADSTGEGLVDTLVAKNVLRVADVAQARAAHAGVEFVKLSDLRLTDDVIKAVPRHIAKRYNVVPILKDE